MDPEGGRFEVIGPILNNFLIILNTESKIFFGLLSRRLSDFILGNGYIDTSVQKVCQGALNIQES